MLRIEGDSPLYLSILHDVGIGRMTMFARLHGATMAVLAGTTASLMLAGAPALAQEGDILVRGVPEGTRVEMVSYSDLNLRYIAHLNILNERVGRAVRKVCEFEPRDMMKRSYDNCAASSWAGARPQIHRAYLRANRLAYLGR